MLEPGALTFSITKLSENTLSIDFCYNDNSAPSPQLARLLATCRTAISTEFSHWVIDIVPAFTGLLIYYQFRKTSFKKFCYEDFEKNLKDCVSEQVQKLENWAPDKKQSILEIPVLYNEETGPDLYQMSRQKNLSMDEIARLHTAEIYTVYALGFLPGFAYLGFVNELLTTPRLANPRKKIMRGSVGIADAQTGIYPSDSPGGWNIIGRTPIDLATSVAGRAGNNTSALAVGDRVKFFSISSDTYRQLAAADDDE